MSTVLSQEEILKSFTFIHGDTYDYNKVIYKTMREKVIITCEDHGDFEQLPFAHTRGQGCPKCARLKHRIDKETIQLRLYEKFKGYYIYDNLDDVTMRTKLKIICPVHGEFHKKLQKHIDGSGCPKCKKIRNENTNIFLKYRENKHLKIYTENSNLGNRPGIFYMCLFKINKTEFIKIGITSKSIEKRFNKSEYDKYTYKILQKIETTNLISAKIEHHLLKNCNNRFIFSPDIIFNGYSECFDLSDKDILISLLEDFIVKEVKNAE